MAFPLWDGKGTFQSGTGALTVPWPTAGTYAAGDFALLFVESANQAIATPAGWTQVTNSPQATGTAAAAGGVMLAAFYKFAASGSETSVTVADSGDHTTAQIHVFTGVNATTPIYSTAGKVDATATASMSWPNSSIAYSEHLVVLAAAMDTDAASTTTCSGYTNGQILSITEQNDQTVISGAGGGLVVATGTTTAATGSGTGTTAATGSTSVTHAYLTIVLNPVTPAYPVSLTENASSSSTQNASIVISPGSRTYFFGGTPNTGSALNVDLFSPSNETSADMTSGISGFSLTLSGANPVMGSSNGYFVGSNLASATGCFKFVFSSEVYSTLSATVASNVATVSASYSTTKGYVAGTSNWNNTIVGFTLSSETTATLSATLGTGRSQSAGVSASTAGYVMGGGNASPQGAIDKITFASDTAAVISATLGTWRQRATGTFSASNGYAMGGVSGGGTDYSAKTTLDFSNDTAADVDSGITCSTQGMVKTDTAGYLGGGSPFATRTTAIDKLLYSSGAYSALSATLAVARDYIAGMYPSVAAGSISINISNTENASATASQDTSANTFAAAATENATASSTQSAAMTFVSAASETTTASDTVGAGLTFAGAATETTTASDTTNATPTFAAIAAESTTATAAQDTTASFAATVTETAAATTTQSTTAQFSASDTENAAATDAASVGSSFAASDTENAAASDTPTSFIAMPAADTETAAANSTQGAAAQFSASDTETAAASDSASTTAQFFASDVETAAASSTQSGAYSTDASDTETATATDTVSSFTGGGTFSVGATETATATASQGATATFAVTITETGSASDSPNAARTSPVSVSEITTATDSQGYTYVVSRSVSEPANATDSAAMAVQIIALDLEQATAFASADSGMQLSAAVAEIASAIANAAAFLTGQKKVRGRAIRVFREVATLVASIPGNSQIVVKRGDKTIVITKE